MIPQMVTISAKHRALSELLTLQQVVHDNQSGTTDVKLMCRDGCVLLHSAIFALASPFFKQLFLDYHEQKVKSSVMSVVFPDFKVSSVHAVVQMMYCGAANIPTTNEAENVQELLKILGMDKNPAFSIELDEPEEHAEGYLPALYCKRRRGLLGSNKVKNLESFQVVMRKHFTSCGYLSRQNAKESRKAGICDINVHNTENEDANSRAVEVNVGIGTEENKHKSAAVAVDEEIEIEVISCTINAKKNHPATAVLLDLTGDENNSRTENSTATVEKNGNAKKKKESFSLDKEKGNMASHRVVPESDVISTRQSKRTLAKKISQVANLSSSSDKESDWDPESEGRNLRSSLPGVTRKSAVANIDKRTGRRKKYNTNTSNSSTDEDEEDNGDTRHKEEKRILENAKVCGKCGKTYDNPKEASNCVTEKHKMIRCYFCFQVFENTDTLFQHYSSHKQASKENHLECPVCKLAVSYKAVSTHVISSHMYEKSTGSRKDGRRVPTTPGSAPEKKTPGAGRMNERPIEDTFEDDDDASLGENNLLITKKTSTGQKKVVVGGDK